MNQYGEDVGCLLIDPYSNRTYLVIQLEPGCTNIVAEYETLIQGLRKAINMNVKYIEVFGDSQKVIKQIRNSMHCISNCMGNFEEVWSLINEFKVFNMKFIPCICNASIDMFKHNVRLEYHSDLWGTLGRTCTKSLQWKRQKILLSPMPLVKIKLNKLLAARIIVSVHAQKGRTVRLKTIRC